MALETGKKTSNNIDSELGDIARRKTVLAVAGSTAASVFRVSPKYTTAATKAADTLCERIMLPQQSPVTLEFVPIYAKYLDPKKAKRLGRFVEYLAELVDYSPDFHTKINDPTVTANKPEKADILNYLKDIRRSGNDLNTGHVFVATTVAVANISEGPRVPQPGEVYSCYEGKFNEIVEPHAVIFKTDNPAS